MTSQFLSSESQSIEGAFDLVRDLHDQYMGWDM